MCLPAFRQCALPPAYPVSRANPSAPLPPDPAVKTETPTVKEPSPEPEMVTCDSYDIPVFKPLCKEPSPQYDAVCEVAFDRKTVSRANYPANNNTEPVDLSSKQGVERFLDTYAQVDQERGADPVSRGRGERQCATACVIAAYLVSDQQTGLEKLTKITEDRLVALAKQRNGISESAKPFLKDSRPFLEGLQKRIGENKVTRGDIERLQDILSTVINESGTVDGLKADQSLLLDDVRKFFEGTDFKPMLAKHNLEFMGVPDHVVLKIEGKSVFDPFPQVGGDQLTDNPWHVSRYNHSQQQEENLHGQINSSLK